MWVEPVSRVPSERRAPCLAAHSFRLINKGPDILVIDPASAVAVNPFLFIHSPFSAVTLLWILGTRRLQKGRGVSALVEGRDMKANRFRFW